MHARVRFCTALSFIMAALFCLPATGVAQWEQTDGPEGPAINGFTSMSGHIFAASVRGLYASTDGGYHWSTVGGQLADANIALVDRDAMNVYAVTDSGLLRSSDLGLTWRAGGKGLLASPLAFAHMGSRLFCATYHGVFSSLDAGLTWKADTAGLQTLTWDLAVVGATLFAGTATGLYASSDSGVTWTLAQGQREGQSVDFLTVVGSDLFAYSFQSNTLSKSTDLGTTWTTVYDQNAVDPYGNIGFVTPADSVLFLGAKGKQWPFVWRSTDGGATWTRTSFRYDYLYVYAGVDAGNGFLVGTNKGVFRTNDGGTSWWSSNAGMTSSNVSSLWIRNGRLLCGTDRTIFSSDVHGSQWIFDGGGSSAIASFSSDWDGRVEGIATLGASTLLSTSRGIYTSQIPMGRYECTGDSGPQGKLFVSGALVFGIDSVRVLRSADTCRTWETVGGAIENPVTVAGGTGVLFVGTVGHGLFSSYDSGETWVRVSGGLGDTLTVSAVEAAGATVCIATSEGVYLSDDGGFHWARTNVGLQGVVSVLTFALDGGDVYAGTTAGVFSLKGGRTQWAAMNDGMDRIRPVHALVVNDGALYAGTLGGGVWRTSLRASQTTILAARQSGTLPKDATLQQNYPNPFNPSTTIAYHVVQPGQVRLTVYDILGREVARLVDEFQREGAHTVRFDAERLSSGTYICRLETAGTSSIRKMTLLK